jgi:signal transduction histidine kinase
MQRTLNFSKYLLHPIPLLVVGFVVLIVGLLAINHITMPFPESVMERLIILLTGTGILLTFITFAVYKSGVLYYLNVRLLLAVMVVVIVGVVLFYQWMLSQLLFSYSYYFPMISTVMFFTAMVAITIGYFVSRAMTSRLFSLSDAAGEVAQGNFGTRLDARGNDEIAYLIRSFNAMAHDLQAVDEQKRQLEQTRRDLVAWVSHDLRTPLTSMRVMLEALADGVITDKETQTRYIKTTLSEIHHLNYLINDLFEMAKLDVGHLELDCQATSIADLISDTMGSMMAKAQRKEIKLSGQVDDGIDLVYVAPEKIQRVLKNLLDNALKYTPAGESVKIHARRCASDTIQVDVHNTGVYISQDTLPSLFDSFYRGEKSRATQDNERGTGLGLAIARGFVQAHGGKIWAESSPEKGTIFSFTLPEKLLNSTL